MRKLWWYLDFLILITLILIIVYTWIPVLYQDSKTSYQAVKRRWNYSPGHYKKVKTILYWNKMYAEKHTDFMFGVGDIFKNCPVPHCYATPDRKLFNFITDYDAILFHGIEMQLNDLPTYRSTHQRYIYFSWESPVSRPLNDHEFVLNPNFYNWTMSYRLDSDIRRPYGQVRDIESNKIIAPPRDPDGVVKWRLPHDDKYIPTEDEMLIIKGKKKMAAWFVSHCETNSQREILVNNLQQYFEIDVYGKCGDKNCNKTKNHDCYNLVERDYYFYLSFENTLCKNYITEKLFLPMQKYVIPVVYGGAEYAQFVPPHSYIDVRNFNDTGQLATFLSKLSNNPTEYAKYFWWKKYYSIEDTNESTLCDLCEKLHDSTLPRKSLENFRKYYIKGQCVYTKLINATVA
ncbi:alpha-(1,3)-fucosyltransferase C isoform X1 [Microplitis demolitor]|uniref:alpha-(1,3)-fucosyltransferase C isoform X1 n=2 Tax=Microplitis demolitor TaxID=69319 RepID=UPI0004CD07B9|nr:alpha-(1,3)-fucosyltransferase C isoform X1 [Microplitis demolitor]